MDWRTWLREGRRHIRRGDIAHLLSPLAPVTTALGFAFHPDPSRLSDDLDARDPAFVRWASEGALLLGRLFRLEVHGLEHVPRDGPALLVGNHNGGLLPLDGLFTLASIADRDGPERAPYALAHDLVLYDPVSHRLGHRLGILRAGHASGEQALRRGHLCLVYPGSDLDTYRPFKDRHRVVLGGRTGFLRLALRERVPIIPVLSAGTHEQWVVLARGDRLAHTLGTDRLLRAKVMPLALALPFGLAPGFFPYLPAPAQTTLAFGRPLTWPELGPEAASSPEALARCLTDVTAAMQRILDALAKDRVPFIGQPPAARALIDAAL